MTTQGLNPIRYVAYFEAFKGVLVALVGTGLLSLVHRDVLELATRLVEHAHLNPASKYPSIFLQAASHMGDSRLMLLALGAAAYAAVRLTEAYGLYFERAWAEWLAAVSGAIYVPVEVFQLVRRPSWLGAALLLLNLAVVAVMVQALRARRRQRLQAGPAPA